jgi:hypothetical protein
MITLASDIRAEPAEMENKVTSELGFVEADLIYFSYSELAVAVAVAVLVRQDSAAKSYFIVLIYKISSRHKCYHQIRLI